MTTINVNSSCEVLWISRHGSQAVNALFNNTDQPLVSSLPDVTEGLTHAGALWLAEYQRVGPITSPGDTKYTSPDGTGDSDVISCSWSKNISSPAGVFQLQVKLRTSYDRMIAPGDMVVIFMDDDHRYGIDRRVDGTMVTIGIVDSIGVSTTVDGKGATVQVASISGRDFGAILQETSTFFDTSFTQLESTYLTNDYVHAVTAQQSVALSPVENVMTLLDIVFNTNSTRSKLVGAQWGAPGALNEALVQQRGLPVTSTSQSLVSLLDITTFSQVPMVGYALADGNGIAQSGNVWSLLTGFVNGCVNEFFVDIRDNSDGEQQLIAHLSSTAAAKVSSEDTIAQVSKVEQVARSGFNRSMFVADGVSGNPVLALVHRQRPYDKDAFEKLPTTDLHHTEVFDYEVTTSSHDVVNFFRARFPMIQPQYQEQAWGILVNGDSVQRFGIRRCDVETMYSFLDSHAAAAYTTSESEQSHRQDFVDAFRFYTELLSDWNIANEQLQSGTISCRYLPRVRVGTRLRYTRVDDVVINFYIEAVHHSFSVEPGSSRTQLTVVRGVEEGKPELSAQFGLFTEGDLIPVDKRDAHARPVTTPLPRTAA